jgi:hypothetical protein
MTVTKGSRILEPFVLVQLAGGQAWDGGVPAEFQYLV